MEWHFNWISGFFLWTEIFYNFRWQKMNFFLKAINDENDLQDMRTLSNRPNVQGKYRLENQQKDEEKKKYIY